MVTDNPDFALLSRLTAKQREVLDLVLAHKSSKEIARVLEISPYTVDQRITGARQKFGVLTRGELAREYSRLRGVVCEETVYQDSHMVFQSPSRHELPQDQQTDPVFMLSDSSFLKMDVPWHLNPEPQVGLEALDNRFGIFGRVALIFGLAALIAFLMVSMLAIAQTLSNIL